MGICFAMAVGRLAARRISSCPGLDDPPFTQQGDVSLVSGGTIGLAAAFVGVKPVKYSFAVYGRDIGVWHSLFMGWAAAAVFDLAPAPIPSTRQ